MYTQIRMYSWQKRQQGLTQAQCAESSRVNAYLSCDSRVQKSSQLLDVCVRRILYLEPFLFQTQFNITLITI